MNKPAALRFTFRTFDRQTLLLEAIRVAALALASVLTVGCSITPPAPPHCDGSDRRAINTINPAVAAMPPSKSCSGQTASTLGSRDSG